MRSHDDVCHQILLLKRRPLWAVFIFRRPSRASLSSLPRATWTNSGAALALTLALTLTLTLTLTLWTKATLALPLPLARTLPRSSGWLAGLARRARIQTSAMTHDAAMRSVTVPATDLAPFRLGLPPCYYTCRTSSRGPSGRLGALAHRIRRRRLRSGSGPSERV